MINICSNFNMCGGCAYQDIKIEEELKIKNDYVFKLVKPFLGDESIFEEIINSPEFYEYRNKVELTFGNDKKDGELLLGFHKKNAFYDIIDGSKCNIMSKEMATICSETASFFRDKQIDFYHKKTHTGILRHLLLRQSCFNNELLISLVTTSNMDLDIVNDWKDRILNLDLNASSINILHTINDNIADKITNEQTNIIHGKDYITEQLLGITFNIGPFSFFQTNSRCAEILYSKVLSNITDSEDVIYDLYSGTGTIAQIVASKAKKVNAIEIVEEAVMHAKDNAKLNNIDNINFICGDVLEKIEEITEKPDIVILDPPRSGVNKKALNKIFSLKPKKVIYVSCNPESFVRDFILIKQYGYKLDYVCPVNMFPRTKHVECVTVLNKI